MKKYSSEKGFPPPEMSDLGWGAIYSTSFVVGMLFVASYATNAANGPMMTEITTLFGVLMVLAAHKARSALAVTVVGGVMLWIALDPIRDVVATALLVGILIGAGTLMG